jgi:tetratricopeptide (TPR) repeat protein
MFKIKLFAVLLAATTFLAINGCQEQQEQASSLYPESELPVNAASDEALQAFVDGLALFDLGQGREARDFFDKALELDPGFVSARMYRAFSSNSAKDFAENRDKLLAMRENANDAEVIMMDIVEANMRDDEKEILDLSMQLVEKFPNSARAQNQLAGAYNGLEDYENARAQMKKALELDPDFLPAISGLGGSYLFNSPKDFNEAEQYMAMAVEKSPQNSRSHIDLGDCYRAQNDLEKALASYQKAAELNPEDEVAHSKAGHANSFLGNYDEARKNFQDARAASEFGTDSYNFEACTYLYEGDHEKAMAFLEEAAAAVDAMDIPESNKRGTKMNCAFNCAMISMHHDNAEQLKKFVAMMKPMSEQIGEDIGSDAARANQAANRHYWDAVIAAMEGDYEGAAANADLITDDLASINDPQKNRRYHRVHAMVNYEQGNYEKALEHAAELNMDNIYDKYWMAKAHQAAGNTDEAMVLFKEIAEFNFNGVAYALIRNEAKEIVAAG